MAREFGRSSRVASQIQKELALILQRGLVIRGLGFVTLNEVLLSKDLAVAKIYFTVLNTDDQGKKEQAKILNASAPFIRSELAKRMRLRNVPEIRFYYDDSFETGMRVAQLLRDLDDSQDG